MDVTEETIYVQCFIFNLTCVRACVCIYLYISHNGCLWSCVCAVSRCGWASLHSRKIPANVRPAADVQQLDWGVSSSQRDADGALPGKYKELRSSLLDCQQGAN